LALLLATSADLGIAWDEAHTIRRERILHDWFSRVVHPRPEDRFWSSFSDRALDQAWPFSREEPDGHPPFYALLGLSGWVLTHRVLRALAAYRFGPMALTAGTAGVLYCHIARRHGRFAGLTAAVLLLIMPRLFAHSHYAHYDMPMTSLWLLAQVAFINSLRSPRWAVPFGVALGLSAGTKFTGCFAVVAPTVWVVGVEGCSFVRRVWRGADESIRSPARGARSLVLGLPIATITLVAIQPPWWFNPVRGFGRYLRSNLTRDETIPIPTLYLGQVYGFALPWHNTFVLTAVTTPVAVLALALLGLAASWAWRRTEPGVLLWPLGWAVLMIVRGLPNAPGHDVIRLFLPSIASLAVLAGFGVAWLEEILEPRRLGWIARVAAALAIGESLAGIAQTYPYTDSYYNVAVGGLRGAERLGFELTYYGETISGPEFLGWVRSEARRHPPEFLFAAPLATLPLLREWKELPRSVIIVTPEDASDPARAPDYVMQRRRGVYMPHEWWLERHGYSHFTVRRQGVDLLRVYTLAELRRALRATKNIPMPDYIKKHFGH
jgi:hypothetical protein